MINHTELRPRRPVRILGVAAPLAGLLTAHHIAPWRDMCGMEIFTGFVTIEGFDSAGPRETWP